MTIDDLNAVVFDGREDVQLVFTCPVCGDEIRVGVHIPNLHMAAAGIAELFDEVSAMDSADERFQVFSVTQAEPLAYWSSAVAFFTALPLFVNLTVSVIAVADVVVPPAAATPVRL